MVTLRQSAATELEFQVPLFKTFFNRLGGVPVTDVAQHDLTGTKATVGEDTFEIQIG